MSRKSRRVRDEIASLTKDVSTGASWSNELLETLKAGVEPGFRLHRFHVRW
jgi:hypothetical protein